MTDLADNDLIAAVARGDHPALLALYDRHGRIAYCLARRILGDAGEAEEAVQDAYLRLWRRAATFDASRGGARSWLLTIVHHCAIDLLRRRAGAPPVVADLDEIADRRSVPDAWTEVSMRIERDRVRTAVETLPWEQRRAVEMAFFDGLTHREIAERDGLPLGTVKGRLRLGLKRLSGLLAEPAVQGLGLGLSVSKQVVELHGGQIRDESPAGGGTRVVVTLPMKAGEHAISHAAD
jgi:RNA polymerase sigma-70 factor (ECF subfamily)